MACVTSPTATQTNLFTSQSLSTSFSEVVTTLPDSTQTSTIQSCVATASTSGGGCISTSDILSVITIPGAAQTQTVPVVVTRDVVNTDIATLFGTSCPPNVTPPPPPTSTSSTVFTSSAESTLPNGQVTTAYTTLTSVIPPSVVQTTSSSGSLQPTGSTTSSNSNLGPIIGGAVGGVVGLIGIVLLVWFILKRRKRWDDIFDKDDDNVIAAAGGAHGRFSLSADVEPKPYEYGLVGHGPSPHTPPGSPPMSGSNIGTDSAMSSTFAPLVAADAHRHMKNRSSIGQITMPPPLAPPPGGRTPSMTHSRPSTSGSIQPLVQGYPQQQHYPPYQQQQQQQYLNTRPPSAHSHSQSSSISSPPLQPQFMGWANPNAVTGPPEDPSYFNRAGSPRSPQSFSEASSPPAERRLQLVNSGPRSSVATEQEMYSPGRTEDTSYAASSSAATTSSGGAQSPGEQRDGKGRLRLVGNEKPVLVHMDGGLVQRQQQEQQNQAVEAAAAAAAASSSGNAGPSSSAAPPPAYEE